MSASRKDLRISTAEGAAANVTVGIGETYLPAFVLALSGSQLACGLVTTVPLMLGAVLQLISPWMVGRWRSYRRWVVCCAIVQAATFVPLAIAAVAGNLPLPVAFAIISMYWAASMASGPAWNTWMETLVPQRVRPRYFAWRTRMSQWGIAGGFLLGGFALHVAAGGGHLAAFALLFLVAAASRLCSAGLLASQREPLPPASSLRPPAGTADLAGAASPGKATCGRSGSTAIFGRLRLSSLTRGVNRRLLLYLLAAQAAVQIAAPYFNPYMLGHLKFSYSAYVALICAPMLTKMVCLPVLGRLVERGGAYRVFWRSAMAIVLLPGMWLISSHFAWLLGIQIFSGLVWGANDLASLMLFFETIPRPQRIGVLTVFNLANAIATAAGSLFGGALLAVLGANGETYLVLFALSTLARAAALVLLVSAPAAAMLRHIKALRSEVPIAPQSQPVSTSSSRRLQGPHWSRKVGSAVDRSPAAAARSSGKA